MNDHPLGELDYKSLAQSVLQQALKDAFLEPYPYNIQAREWLLGEKDYAWFEFWCEHAGMTPQGVSRRIKEILEDPSITNHVIDLLKTPLELWTNDRETI